MQAGWSSGREKSDSRVNGQREEIDHVTGASFLSGLRTLEFNQGENILEIKETDFMHCVIHISLEII